MSLNKTLKQKLDYHQYCKLKINFIILSTQAVLILIVAYLFLTVTTQERCKQYWKVLELPTKQQLYGHLPPITKTIQVRRSGHGVHCYRSRDELISEILLRPLHMDEQKQDDQLEAIYNGSLPIQDVVLKT